MGIAGIVADELLVLLLFVAVTVGEADVGVGIVVVVVAFKLGTVTEKFLASKN